MPSKENLITVGMMAAGVLLAGWLMNQFSDVAVFDDAKQGFK